MAEITRAPEESLERYSCFTSRLGTRMAFGDSRISRLKPMHLPEYLQQASSSRFDLEELILREKWEEGIRTDQYSRIFGSGQFEFASDEAPYIEVNGTIPIIHMQSEGGETVADTIIVDGTYDGDAEGSFGLVRRIVESDVYGNATGTSFRG